MTETDIRVSAKFFSESLSEFLLQEPDWCDVTFAVGPKQEKVSALKIILLVASPVLRKLFKEKWDQGVVKKGEGIPLPDVDPSAFKIFLKLLPSEHVDVETIEKLDLSEDQILNLIAISKMFGMHKMQSVFEELSLPLLKEFEAFAKTPEFLKLSAENLATIFGNDDLCASELEIFQHAFRWAENHCSILGLPVGQENLRFVLGDCLKEIRFPLMDGAHFGKFVCTKNILTLDEISKLFQFISLDSNGRQSFDTKSLGFSTKSRKVTVQSELQPLVRLYKDTELDFNSFGFSCRGDKLSAFFTCATAVQLLGIGFAGPRDSDAEYVVEVEPKKDVKDAWISCGKAKQVIRAKHRQNFYFMLETPQTFTPCSGSNILICYWLTGPPIKPVCRNYECEIPKNFSKSEKNEVIKLGMLSNHIVELILKKP